MTAELAAAALADAKLGPAEPWTDPAALAPDAAAVVARMRQRERLLAEQVLAYESSSELQRLRSDNRRLIHERDRAQDYTEALERRLERERFEYVVTCDWCGVSRIGFSDMVDEATLAIGLRALGWTVTEREHQCPRCKP